MRLVFKLIARRLLKFVRRPAGSHAVVVHASRIRYHHWGKSEITRNEDVVRTSRFEPNVCDILIRLRRNENAKKNDHILIIPRLLAYYATWSYGLWIQESCNDATQSGLGTKLKYSFPTQLVRSCSLPSFGINLIDQSNSDPHHISHAYPCNPYCILPSCHLLFCAYVVTQKKLMQTACPS
jgi:hypothetical protein